MPYPPGPELLENATARLPRAVRGGMQISGSMLQAATYDVAVAKKALQSTREQGQQALQLIQSATPAPASASSGVGTRLNVTA